MANGTRQGGRTAGLWACALLALVATAAFTIGTSPAPEARAARAALGGKDEDGGTDTVQAHRFYRAGAALLAQGQTEQALREFQNASFFDHDDSEIRYGQGLCLVRLGAPTEARVQLERALDRAPNHAGAHYQLGLALAMLADSAGARTHLERATVLDPRMPGAHRALAHLAQAKLDWEGALAQLRLERSVAPESALTWYDLGRTFTRLANNRTVAGDGDSAQASFAAAIARDSSLVPAYVELGHWVDEVGSTAEAARVWGEAARRDTTRADLAAASGVALFRDGRFAEAATVLARAARQNPRDAKSVFNLGVVREKLGDDPGALLAYADASARDTTYADPWFNRGLALMRAGRDDEARDALERSLALAPGGAQAPDARRALAAIAARRAHRTSHSPRSGR